MIEEYYSRYVPAPVFIEDMEMYTPGGFHPVTLQDSFQDRYTVIHKLGAGGSATVWLAHDAQEKRFVALKIVSACMSEFAEIEAATHKELQAKIDKSSLDKFLVPLLDDFWIDGPNGKHFCLVQSVCGPSLLSFRRNNCVKIRPDLICGLVKELTLGLALLHDVGLVYGDLSAGNVAFALRNLDEHSIDEVLELLGRPQSYPVSSARASDTEWAAKHGPSRVYDSIDLTEADHMLSFLNPEIRLIDLGASYFLPKHREDDGTAFTESYIDPSCLWMGEETTQVSDVWSLACIFFEMRSATELFENNSRGVIAEITDRIGPMPKDWEDDEDEVPEETEEPQPTNDVERMVTRVQSKRESFMLAVNKIPHIGRLKRFCQQIISWIVQKPATNATLPTKPARTRHQRRGNDPSLHGQIKNIGNRHPWHKLTIPERREILERLNANMLDDAIKYDTSDEALDRGPPPHSALSDEEAADLEDLLRKMLTWRREDRVTVAQVLEHAWLNKTYVEEDQDKPWVQRYHFGTGYEKNGEVYI